MATAQVLLIPVTQCNSSMWWGRMQSSTFRSHPIMLSSILSTYLCRAWAREWHAGGQGGAPRNHSPLHGLAVLSSTAGWCGAKFSHTQAPLWARAPFRRSPFTLTLFHFWEKSRPGNFGWYKNTANKHVKLPPTELSHWLSCLTSYDSLRSQVEIFPDLVYFQLTMLWIKPLHGKHVLPSSCRPSFYHECLWLAVLQNIFLLPDFSHLVLTPEQLAFPIPLIQTSFQSRVCLPIPCLPHPYATWSFNSPQASVDFHMIGNRFLTQYS